MFDELEAFALDGGDQAFEVVAVGLGEAELGLLAVVVMRSDDGADCVAVRYDRGILNGARNRHVAHASAVAKEWPGEEFDRARIEVLAKQTTAQGRIGFADGVLGHWQRQIVQRDFQQEVVTAIKADHRVLKKLDLIGEIAERVSEHRHDTPRRWQSDPDMLMVAVPDEVAVKVGDDVVLIGTQGEEEITVNEIARLADTIPYEIFTGLSLRVPRIYY